jgi:hypothetical protein
MQQSANSTRKKFLLWGAAIFSSVTALKFFTGSKKPKPVSAGKNSGTVKMLTQDGKLVEIDKELLAAGTKKITDKELQGWVKK